MKKITVLLFLFLLITPSFIHASGGYNFSRLTGVSMPMEIWVGPGEEDYVEVKGTAIKMSNDGLKMVVSSALGYVYTSNNGGVTWATSTSAGLRNWSSLAMTPDGSKIVATAKLDSYNTVGEYIYISDDSGQTWGQRPYGGRSNTQTTRYQGWSSVAMSTSGQKIVATPAVAGGGIHISNDGGTTFASSTSTLVNTKTFSSIVMSADGTKLIALESSTSPKPMYMSNDGGITWATSTSAGSQPWRSIAMTPDGSKIVAGVTISSVGYVFMSADGGATWSSTPGFPTTGDALQVIDNIAISSDGSKIFAASSQASERISYDGGATWHRSIPGIGNIGSAAFSADSSKLAFVRAGYGSEVYMGIFDSAHPILSSVSTSTATNSFSLSFNTDENATSTLNWGVKDYLQSTTTISALDNFSFNVTNLIPCTNYSYTLRYSDIWNNIGETSSDFYTIGCPGNSNIFTSTSMHIEQDVGGSISLDDLNIQAPVSYASTSAVFQINKLDSSSVIYSYGTPSSQQESIGNYSYNITALPTATSSLSVFDNPISLELSYDSDNIPSTINPSTLTLYKNDNGAWSPLSCSVDTNLSKVTCSINSPTVVTLFGSYYPVAQVATTPRRSGSRGGSTSSAIVNNVQTNLNTTQSEINNVTSISIFRFTRNLSLGSHGEDVKALQDFLISNKYKIPAGSTGYFGQQTVLALAQYQKDKNISPATGYFGPITIDSLKQNSSSPSATIQTTIQTTTQVSTSEIYTRNLSLGSHGEDVKALQDFLISNKYKIPAGSTGYFGQQTVLALAQYQKDKNISPATGYFGLITREFIK